MLKIETYELKIELIEDMLGTVPKNKRVYGQFIATKAKEHLEREQKRADKAGDEPRMASGEVATEEHVAQLQEEEVETVADVEERGWTGFHEDKDGPFLLDYVVRGFLGEAARTLREVKGAGEKDAKGESKDLKQLQDKVKRYCFVSPRRIRLPKPDMTKEWDENEKPMIMKPVNEDGFYICERPLRAQTPQGPRVTVTRSDVILAGAQITCQLKIMQGGGLTKDIMLDILSYGQFIGLGQWRSGGWGRFTVLSFEKIEDTTKQSKSAKA